MTPLRAQAGKRERRNARNIARSLLKLYKPSIAHEDEAVTKAMLLFNAKVWGHRERARIWR
jgi:hypothetical protein